MSMRKERHLKSMSDADLLRRLSELLKSSRHVEAELIAHLAELDDRRLYAPHASSLFNYCTRVLRMSEYEAFLRMRVARASRKYPLLLEMLADGRLHLSGIDKLAPHLTDDNCETVLARASHQSKRKIEELVAELSPRPDVPSSIRKLPKRNAKVKPQGAGLLGPDKVNPGPPQNKPEVGPLEASPPLSAPSRPAKVEPLAPAKFKITFTASVELKNKLEKLRSLMRSSVPDGDLAVLIEEAVTEKLEKLESKRYGTTKKPRKDLGETDTSASSRYIPAPVRRAVVERDQHRCTFVDATGRRCDETEWLEFHHVEPYGRGGDHSPDNIFLLCRTHNRYLAELDYGKEKMLRYRSTSDRVSEPAILYAFSHRAARKQGIGGPYRASLIRSGRWDELRQ